MGNDDGVLETSGVVDVTDEMRERLARTAESGVPEFALSDLDYEDTGETEPCGEPVFDESSDTERVFDLDSDRFDDD